MRCLLCILAVVPGSIVIGAPAVAQEATFDIQMQRDGFDGIAPSMRGVATVSDSVCWASGAGGRYFRTTDGGTTWANATVPGAENVDFRDVHAWSADKALLMGIASPARFFLTEDGGETWDEVFHDDDAGAFFDALDFWDDQRGVAFGDPVDGKLNLLTTDDGGKSWKRVPRENIPDAAAGEGGFAGSGTCLVIGPDGLALIGLGGAVPGGKSRVMRSDDYGATWTVTESPMRSNASSGIFSLLFVDKNHVVAVGGDYQQTESPEQNAMSSSDGGRTWTMVERDRPTGFRSAVAAVRDANAQVTALISCGPNGVDVSSDGGRSWRNAAVVGFHALSISADGVGWLVGSGGRIARIAATKD